MGRILAGTFIGVGAELVVNHLILGMLGMGITTGVPHLVVVVAFALVGGIIAARR